MTTLAPAPPRLRATAGRRGVGWPGSPGAATGAPWPPRPALLAVVAVLPAGPGRRRCGRLRRGQPARPQSSAQLPVRLRRPSTTATANAASSARCSSGARPDRGLRRARRCSPASSRPGRSATPGPRASAGCGGLSPSWCPARSASPPSPPSSARWSPGTSSRCGRRDPQRLHGTCSPSPGVAVVGWGLAAYAVGVLAGLVWRRVVPALAATLAAVDRPGLPRLDLRGSLPDAPRHEQPAAAPTSDVPIDQWWTHGGVRVSDAQINQVLQAIGVQHATADGLPGRAGAAAPSTRSSTCSSTATPKWTSYQPDSRYWTFQWIEFGWLTALSLLLLAATLWLVRRKSGVTGRTAPWGGPGAIMA